jgi:hypothetical protein
MSHLRRAHQPPCRLVPHELLRLEGARGEFLADYDATELAVPRGEMVHVAEIRHGWTLVTNSEGARGWIPVACAAPPLTPDGRAPGRPGCATLYSEPRAQCTGITSRLSAQNPACSSGRLQAIALDRNREKVRPQVPCSTWQARDLHVMAAGILKQPKRVRRDTVTAVGGR